MFYSVRALVTYTVFFLVRTSVPTALYLKYIVYLHLWIGKTTHYVIHENIDHAKGRGKQAIYFYILLSSCNDCRKCWNRFFSFIIPKFFDLQTTKIKTSTRHNVGVDKQVT